MAKLTRTGKLWALAACSLVAVVLVTSGGAPMWLYMLPALLFAAGIIESC